MKDPIIEEVRRIRKEIESQNNNDWDKLEAYFVEKQVKRTEPPVTYNPQRLPDRGVA